MRLNMKEICVVCVASRGRKMRSDTHLENPGVVNPGEYRFEVLVTLLTHDERENSNGRTYVNRTDVDLLVLSRALK